MTREELLLRLSNHFISVPAEGMDVAIQQALETIGRYVEVSTSFLYEFDVSHSMASKAFEWCAPGVTPTREHLQGITADTMRYLFPRAIEGEILRFNRLSELEALDADAQSEVPRLKRLGISAFISVPIRVGSRVTGLVGFEMHGRDRVWTDDEQRLLLLAADMFGQALDRGVASDRIAFHINNTPLGVMECDADLRVRRWSAASEQIFGWTAQEVIGKRWGENWRFVYEEDDAHVADVGRRLVEGGESSIVSHNRNYTRDGRVLDCEWFNSVLRDRQGKVLSILSFVQDETEKRKTRATLEANEAELRRLHAELQSRASEALRESELRYGYLADQATDLISCHDLEGHYFYASPSAEKFLGYKPQELIGQIPFQFIHPEDRERMHELHQREISGTGVWTATFRLCHKDGSYAWCETALRVVDSLNDDGQKQVIAVTRNIEERKKAEAALRESELRYRHLTENATDMISLHDAEGCFKFLSPACQRLLGYEPAELMGGRLQDLAHPEDRAAVVDGVHRLREASESELTRTTFRARHKDGQYVWLESTSRNDGHEIIVVSRDISGRLNAEQRLRLIQTAVDQVQEAVIITDTQLHRPGPNIVYVNPAFTAMTGYQPEEVYGKSPRILQGPQTEKTMLDRMRRGLSRGEPVDGQAVNYRKDGSTYVVEWNINPLRDVDGNIVNWVAIQRDITARFEQEELKRMHREELAHVTRLSTMGEMASGLAHEINQPLTAISNYMNGCLQRVKEDRITKQELIAAMGRVAGQADRAGQIIRRLRAFVTKRGTKRSPQEINELIHETVALIDANLRENETVITYRLAEGLPTLNLDGIQIEQVLLNLVRNAMEAMLGNPVIDRTIEIESGLNDAGEVFAAVSDVGVGMSPDQLNHLFEPFYTTKDHGMGIGLTISQSIIEAHGGRLWAETREPRGTTFRFTLPTSSKKRVGGMLLSNVT